MLQSNWGDEVKKLGALAEYHRREKSNGLTDVTPVGQVEVMGDLPDTLVDYAEALQAITTAMHHLNEAIPNRQPNRIRAAYALLAMGKRALGDFLETKNIL